jgi:hypothetical protein
MTDQIAMVTGSYSRFDFPPGLVYAAEHLLRQTERTAGTAAGSNAGTQLGPMPSVKSVHNQPTGEIWTASAQDKELSPVVFFN